MTPYDETKFNLNKAPQHLCVCFALYCCDDIKDLIKDDASVKAIELVRKWVNDGSVTQSELKAARDAASYTSYTSYAANATSWAANAASYTSSAASWAAYYAVNAAYYAANATSWAANAASWASSAANAASWASSAAFYAAYAVNASSSSKDEKLIQYRNHLNDMILSLTEVERLIYDLNKENK